MLDAWAPGLRDGSTAPNPAGWTLSTLMFCWLLYPFIAKFFRAYLEGSKSRLLGTAIGLYLVAIAPAACTFILNHDAPPGSRIPDTTSVYLYIFPPCRLAEFALGMTTASLMRLEGVDEWGCWPYVAWLGAIVLFGGAAALPYADLGRTDLEALLISLPSILWCIIIAASSHTTLTKHLALTSLCVAQP
jgi:peptidoglycan/LPS O-acetylase OafA/YrhL